MTLHPATPYWAGLGDLADAWQLEEWHNVTEITSWAPPHTERVRGSDGMQFRRGGGFEERRALGWRAARSRPAGRLMLCPAAESTRAS